jgi:hypothetical protein
MRESLMPRSSKEDFHDRRGQGVDELYPDDVNGRVLSSMRASGADMTVPYDVDFEHVFPDLRAAEAFVQRVSKPGQRAKLSEHDGAKGYWWQVRVVVRLVPTYAGICNTEQELAAFADASGGRADGWGILH